ncbi:MAG: S41 family peptidase [Solirubrobacterales bacterium]
MPQIFQTIPQRREPRRFSRVVLRGLLLFTALIAGVYIGSNPNTPVVGGLKDIVSPDKTEISTEQVEELINNEFYRRVDETKLTNGSIKGMVESLKDPYSHYFDREQNKQFAQAISGRYGGIGTAVNPNKRGLEVAVVYEKSPADEAGIRPDDLITEVNGKSIAGESADTAVAKIKGPDGTKVKVTVQSPIEGTKKYGRPRELTLERRQIDLPVATGELVRREGRKVGVIELTSFTENSGAAVAAQIVKLEKHGADSYVLDLRGNGGGRLDQAVAVTSLFVPKGLIVSTDGRARPRQNYNAVKGTTLTADPLVVVVDKSSASASEITAGSLKYRDRALVIGTRTYGKGVFQEVTELKNGGAVSLTVGQYVLPGNHPITKSGLAPDLKVEDDDKTRRDEVLDAAYQALAEFKK